MEPREPILRSDGKVPQTFTCDYRNHNLRIPEGLFVEVIASSQRTRVLRDLKAENISALETKEKTFSFWEFLKDLFRALVVDDD